MFIGELCRNAREKTSCAFCADAPGFRPGRPAPRQPFSPDDCRGRKTPVTDSRNSEVKIQPAPPNIPR